ncbi:MAG TPA: hypothetical protein VGE41_11075, partial [Verrucomicrobiae bacterium]
MKQNTTSGEQVDFNRRGFLKTGSLTTLMAMMGGVALRAEDEKKEGAVAQPEEKHVGPPVNCAIVGCGVQGRELINTLSKLPNAPVVAICDTYEPWLRRSKELAPKATADT